METPAYWKLIGESLMGRKAIIAFIIGGIVALVSLQPALAQTTSYAVKFVCGTLAPTTALTAPSELQVKPGNYATVINMEYLATNTALMSGTYQVWVERPFSA